MKFFYPPATHLKWLAGLAVCSSLVVSFPPALAADIAPRGPSTNERLDLARKAIEAKDWSKALFELNQAAQAEPRNADVHNLLGYTYRKRATPDLPKAFDHYKKALDLNPQHMGAHEYIGEAYFMDKKPAEAEKHLARLEAICGNKTCEEYSDLFKSIADYKAKN